MTNNIYDIEIRLLDTYLKHPDLFEKCQHLVSINIFTRSVTKKCYEIIATLHSQNVVPDSTIIYSQLKKLGFPQAECIIITGANYDYSYATQTEKYVDILFKNSVANYLMPILSDTHQKLLSETGDSIELMDKISESINRVNLVVNNVTKDKNTTTLFEETLLEIKEAMNSVDSMGYSTGLRDVDKITGGLYPGIIVIGARPGMGKTAYIINVLTTNAIELNVPVVMFSLEMPAKQLMRRIISNVCEINSYAIKTGQINEADYAKIEGSKIILQNNLIIDDTPAITWQYIDAKLKSVRKKFPMSQEMIVVIDYIQLMSNIPDETKGRTDEGIMSIRCNKLNALWKIHNCCIIELSQLGREVEKRVPPRPKMSDLKDSGSLEANADVVIMQYRPDYYSEFPKDDQGNDLRGLVEFSVPKNRHGKTGAAYAKFEGQYSRFTDYIPPTNAIQTTANPNF